MAEYQGHKNWNYWNVSLWINNDEDLYNMARGFVRTSTTKVEAAIRMHDALIDSGITETPDGAPYSKSTIRAALVGI